MDERVGIRVKLYVRRDERLQVPYGVVHVEGCPDPFSVVKPHRNHSLRLGVVLGEEKGWRGDGVSLVGVGAQRYVRFRHDSELLSKRHYRCTSQPRVETYHDRRLRGLRIRRTRQGPRADLGASAAHAREGSVG